MTSSNARVQRSVFLVALSMPSKLRQKTEIAVKFKKKAIFFCLQDPTQVGMRRSRRGLRIPPSFELSARKKMAFFLNFTANWVFSAGHTQCEMSHTVLGIPFQKPQFSNCTCLKGKTEHGPLLMLRGPLSSGRQL